MVHTQYHLRVAAPHLPGALRRMGAMLASPLLSPESAQREVQNLHAEFSRNCNSDARKLLQLRRSLGRPPYSQFSTGSVATLRDAPAEAGVDVAAALRGLWGRRYLAPAMTVAVLGPQDPEMLEGLVREAFSSMAATRGCGEEGITNGSSMQQPQQQQVEEGGIGSSGGGGGGGGRYGSLLVYGEEQQGTLLRVAPSRDLRTLELVWFVPYGVMEHPDSKPWRVVGHVLVGGGAGV